MRVAYIAPSRLPSRAANAAHVALQCDGFLRAGANVTLYTKRAMADATRFAAALRAAYDVNAEAMRLVSYFSSLSQADTVRIALMSIPDIARNEPEVILSRNLYAAFVLAVIQRRRILFETHQLETGVRKLMQRAIMLRPWVTTVVISQALIQCLREHHGVAPHHAVVAHDAAPEGIVPVTRDNRRNLLQLLFPNVDGPWEFVCGYFGHLYSGRGVEIVEAAAAARPRVLFLIFGGNDADIQDRRARSRCANLLYMGHVAHPLARRAMTLCDALLMPYQTSVSIGAAGHDTARWMSPMKMFEYLASGVPVISSDLPVLREVLRDGQNCILAPPDNLAAWIAAVDRLMAEPALARTLGATAHGEYLANRSWTRRAELLLAAAYTL